MGRSELRWVSYHSAAKKLGCSIDEIISLVQGHMVRSLADGEAKFVAENDLEELYQLRELPPVDSTRLARTQALLEQRVKRLEAAVNLLYEANQLTSYTMGNLEDQTLIELAANVDQMLDLAEWPLPRLLSCAEVYLKLTEVEIERLVELTSHPDPWRPFFELCLKQLVWLGRSPELLKEYEWARARDLIYQGMKNLRQLALTYCSFTRDPSPLIELACIASQDDVDNLDFLVMKNRQKVPQISDC